MSLFWAVPHSAKALGKSSKVKSPKSAKSMESSKAEKSTMMPAKGVDASKAEKATGPAFKGATVIKEKETGDIKAGKKGGDDSSAKADKGLAFTKAGKEAKSAKSAKSDGSGPEKGSKAMSMPPGKGSKAEDSSSSGKADKVHDAKAEKTGKAAKGT